MKELTNDELKDLNDIIKSLKAQLTSSLERETMLIEGLSALKVSAFHHKDYAAMAVINNTLEKHKAQLEKGFEK